MRLTTNFAEQGLKTEFKNLSDETEVGQHCTFIFVKINSSIYRNCAIVHPVDNDCNLLCFESASQAVDARNRPNALGMLC